MGRIGKFLARMLTLTERLAACAVRMADYAARLAVYAARLAVCAALLMGCAVLLTGCKSRPPESRPVRFVTQVDVQYRHEGEMLTRQYTSTEKISQILNYLRQFRNGNAADTDPERVLGDECRITLRLSDGAQRVYLQRAGRYLSRDAQPWQAIDPKQGELLLPMLEELESDPVSEQ